MLIYYEITPNICVNMIKETNLCECYKEKNKENSWIIFKL